MEETFALLRTHHKNVQRYRQLLQTSLTDFEREYIGGRLREEQLAIETLSSALPTECSTSDPRAAQLQRDLELKPMFGQRRATSPAPEPSAGS